MDRFPEFDPEDSYDTDIEEYITILHELELKSHHVAQLKDFVDILPERKANIIERLRQIGWRYFDPCRHMILETFTDWKTKHQIHDPDAWANYMWDDYTIEYDTDAEAIEGIMQRGGITIGDPAYGNSIDEHYIASMVNEEAVKQNLDNEFWANYDYFESHISNFLEQDYEEQFEESGSEPIEFMEEHDLEDKALEYIHEEIDFESYIVDNEAYHLLDKWDVIEAMKGQLYRTYMINFGGQLEEVFENLEVAEKRLEAVQENDNISKMTVAISLSLNVMHVFGNILTDYGAHGLTKNYLDWLADGTNEIAQTWEQEAKDEFSVGRPAPPQYNENVPMDEMNPEQT